MYGCNSIKRRASMILVFGILQIRGWGVGGICGQWVWPSPVCSHPQRYIDKINFKLKFKMLFALFRGHVIVHGLYGFSVFI